MTRRPCILITTTITIPYDKSKFGEANRAETIAQHLEKAVSETIGVQVQTWAAKHSSVSGEQ